jgi:hypothetical protein
MPQQLTTSGKHMTGANSPSTKPEKRSSSLRAELERLSGQEVVLARVLRNSDQHIGKLAERFVFINWWGETPEVIEEEEQHIIDLLKQYDAALAQEAGEGR